MLPGYWYCYHWLCCGCGGGVDGRGRVVSGVVSDVGGPDMDGTGVVGEEFCTRGRRKIVTMVSLKKV